MPRSSDAIEAPTVVLEEGQGIASPCTVSSAIHS